MQEQLNTSVARYIPTIITAFWIQLTSLHFFSLGNEESVYCGLLFPHIQHLLRFFLNNIEWNKHGMKATTIKAYEKLRRKTYKENSLSF